MNTFYEIMKDALAQILNLLIAQNKQMANKRIPR